MLLAMQRNHSATFHKQNGSPDRSMRRLRDADYLGL